MPFQYMKQLWGVDVMVRCRWLPENDSDWPSGCGVVFKGGGRPMNGGFLVSEPFSGLA
jgi:hypothetical protein